MFRYDLKSTSHDHSLSSTSELINKKSLQDKDSMKSISQYFGELTFGLGEMRERLQKEAYSSLLKTLEHGKKLNKETSDSIALVIKEWAVSQGATHFCHWFQPMTGLTAEKHDAFISIQHSHHSELHVIERFTGSQLIQGEPDASSFPSGGMRSTFEARGYTAWDPTSPIFIVGKTLCIPSVFFGYHGQALDNKTPLLRSLQALSHQACEFLKLIGDVDVKSVSATLGPEQEYFLIDRRLAAKRPDLIMTGRTLVGASSPRGQQLEDHYFGSIPVRVTAFMEDLERELYKLGIPIKTRHNEVAPSQFELAPIFENANIAADHNVLTMETMKRVAHRHGFICLLHEKPFAGINGSGKHCNWSMSNDKGENLLEPGVTPHQNLRFLAVTAIVLKAVDEHADILRASIASPGNDHRLGGNEAPPAIISVFLGSMLNKIFEFIEKGKAAEGTEAQIIDLGVSQIPGISKDYTDRNRTSPFAFTGNKFEFRAVGASANVAVPVTILNSAVADSFKVATQRLKELLANKSGRDEAVVGLIQEFYMKHKRICFEGNNYSEEWKIEAKKRGLPILETSIDALEMLNNEKSTSFLIDQKVLNNEEIKARYFISIERYIKSVEIELNTLRELINQYIIPSVEKQLLTSQKVSKHLTNPKSKKTFGERIDRMELLLEQIASEENSLQKVMQKISSQTSEEQKIHLLVEEAQPIAKSLRGYADCAETYIADEYWTLPKYREMLFANTLI